MNKTLLPDEEFITRFNKACELTKLTNHDIGLIMRCEEKAIGGYRKGFSSPPVSRLKFFCQAFRVSADYLLNLENKKVTTNERHEVEYLKRENEILMRGLIFLCDEHNVNFKKFIKQLELEYDRGIGWEVKE